ncbi:hypothetical protein [Morganella morganii]|uniref:hypothetical protein n=1 Tax=Morganella morganii TaxID=582 RepID=UPI00189995B5|nr:hypothetical protein [Morganella morganii]
MTEYICPANCGAFFIRRIGYDPGSRTFFSESGKSDVYIVKGSYRNQAILRETHYCITTEVLIMKSGTIKYGVISLLFLTLTGVANADVYRDRSGRITGSSVKNSGDTIYRDSRGVYTGRTVESAYGTTSYQDEHGVTTGYSATDAYGKTQYRDRSGAVTGTATKDAYGKVTFTDKNGIVTGTATTDAWGKTTFRDRSGIVTGTQQKQN